MKILFVAPYLPSLLRIRPLRFIQYLSQKHEITLVCLLQPSWTVRFLEELKPFCKQIYPIHLDRNKSVINSLLAIPSTKPMSVAYFTSGKITSQIIDVIQEENFDLIHTEFIRAAPFTENITGIPKIFDAVDSLTLAYERGWQNQYSSVVNRIIAFEEWIKMRIYEPMMIDSFDKVMVSSSIDQKYLSSNSRHSIELLPNGVDNKHYYWNHQDRDDKTIVFVGQMNYYVNVDSVKYFYHSAFRQIKKQIPDIRFIIVGADPKKSIRELAADSTVEVTGYVPDIRPYIARASVFVCPMVCGSGIQNKVLQAMATGIPIVTTPIAIQALQVVNEEHLLITENSEQFAEAVLKLLADNNLKKRLTVNARQYILEHHDWNIIGQRLETIYGSILQ